MVTNVFRFRLALGGLLVVLAAGTVSAIELRDAKLVAAGSPVFQNGGGSVRLEDGRYLTDLDGDGSEESFRNPDFNVKQFRSNAVLRWEFLRTG